MPSCPLWILIPYAAVREGIANALMHRDYFVKSPTQIIRYANRLEFRNAGSSMKPLAQMNIPGSVARNENIAMVFHDLNFAENKGTGIRTIKDAMLKSNLSMPLIESSRDYNTFNLCLLPHHFFDKSDVDWLAQFKQMNLTDEEVKALIVIRELGAITNADYRQMNHVDTLTASQSLQKFRDYGLIYQKGTAAKTYYVPTERLINNEAPQTTPQTTPQTSSLPAHIAEQLSKVDRKISAMELRGIIKDLCKWKPQKLADLAVLLKRNPKHLREHYLTPMLKSQDLEYVYPDNPAHPMQAYKLIENPV